MQNDRVTLVINFVNLSALLGFLYLKMLLKLLVFNSTKHLRGFGRTCILKSIQFICSLLLDTPGSYLINDIAIHI